ncbi:MAG TPA: hypothetical protein VM847_22410, partial [Tahibacter sp.]|nr:hypothetical protein [Tahibacter sp.]
MALAVRAASVSVCVAGVVAAARSARRSATVTTGINVIDVVAIVTAAIRFAVVTSGSFAVVIAGWFAVAASAITEGTSTSIGRSGAASMAIAVRLRPGDQVG